MTAMLRCWLLLLAGSIGLIGPALAARDGEEVYRDLCATCHEGGTERAPVFAALQAMEPVGIVRSLESGAMRVIGTFYLSGPERIAVAEYVTGKTYESDWQSTAVKMCESGEWAEQEPFALPHWNGWAGDFRNWRRQLPAMAGLDAEAVPLLELKWVFAFPGETVTEAPPSVIAGRLFTGSRSGAIYAMDPASGCVHWVFQADASVKTPILIGRTERSGQLTAFFGDLGGRVYAVDATSGALKWKIAADGHIGTRITGGFQLVGKNLFVPVSSLEEGYAADPNYACCTFRGSLLNLDAATGAVNWKRYMIAEKATQRGTNNLGRPIMGPSGASIWSAPTIDLKTGRVYVSTSDNYSHPQTATSDSVVALSMETGEIVWSYQGSSGDVWNTACNVPDTTNCPEDAGPDHDMGASPILVTRANGRRILLAAQKAGVVHALDPDDNGKVLWKKRVARGGIIGGIEWGPATDGKALYVAISDLRWEAGETDAPDFISATTTPVSDKGGGLIALDIETGKTLWEAAPVSCEGRSRCSPAQSAAVTVTPGAVWSGSMSGVMRVFDPESGAVIWEYDTVREYDSVNGAPAHGGAIDGPGVVVVDGRVHMTSGYSKWGALGGNVLLTFEPRKK